MPVFSKETFQRMMSGGKKTVENTDDAGAKGERQQIEAYDRQLSKYRQQLFEYSQKLEEYRNFMTSNSTRSRELLEEYYSKLKALNVNEEDKMAAVQMALDLTYIKEELDEVCRGMDENSFGQTKQQLEQLDERQQDLLLRIVNLDHTVGNPIRKELQESREEMAAKQERFAVKVNKSIGSLKIMLLFSLLLNVACLVGIGCFLLIRMGIL